MAYVFLYKRVVDMIVYLCCVCAHGCGRQCVCVVNMNVCLDGCCWLLRCINALICLFVFDTIVFVIYAC